MFCFWYIDFFLYSDHTLSHFSYNDITNISTRDRAYIWMYLLNCKSFLHETWSTNSHGPYFRKTFCMFWRNGSQIQARFNLPTYRNQSETNFDGSIFGKFSTILKVGNEITENWRSKINEIKHCIILPVVKITQKYLKLVSSHYSRTKTKMKMVVISCSNIWQSFILILPLVLKNRLIV